MAHLIEDLSRFFHLDDVNIDNWHFKLYYKGCVILFFVGSLVGVLSQYFGDPIHCDFIGLDAEVASDYCWIHGSSYIRPEYQMHMKCIADLDGVVSEDDAPDTTYYQWVTFVQLMQAGLFLLPYKLWSYLEGGLLASFGADAKSSVLLSDNESRRILDAPSSVEAAEDAHQSLERVVVRYVVYFRNIQHHCQSYLAKFVMCEALNVALLLINFWATDQFLQGRFWYYGLDFINYYTLSRPERRLVVNPLCATFPTEVSCTVPNIGAAGGEQHHNGLCVLSQNIINEKIYLVIWFYTVALAAVSAVFILYRVSTLLFDGVRLHTLIAVGLPRKGNAAVGRQLRYILRHAYVGDWFVMHQLAQNVNATFFRTFVGELSRELARVECEAEMQEAVVVVAGSRPGTAKAKTTSDSGNGRSVGTKSNLLMTKRPRRSDDSSVAASCPSTALLPTTS